MNQDAIRRILNGEPEPVTKTTCLTLQLEVRDWIRNREAINLDNRLLLNIERHLSVLKDYLKE